MFVCIQNNNGNNIQIEYSLIYFITSDDIESTCKTPSDNVKVLAGKSNYHWENWLNVVTAIRVTFYNIVTYNKRRASVVNRSDSIKHFIT